MVKNYKIISKLFVKVILFQNKSKSNQNQFFVGFGLDAKSNKFPICGLYIIGECRQTPRARA